MHITLFSLGSACGCCWGLLVVAEVAAGVVYQKHTHTCMCIHV